MQKIKKLSPLEIQKIAAGQVVERPANIVKELVENSLDAQANKISIYIEKGGHQVVRVVDDGCGMSYDDAHFCFEHHATSKINSVDDLRNLTTFGFRGEALSSIGAVSTISLTTKEFSAQEGITIVRQSDKIMSEQIAACQAGTDIEVKDIFYNIPVRKKFLKKEKTELRAIINIFQTFCLAYTNVHFQLYHNDKMIYNCPAVNALENRIAQLFDASGEQLLVVDHEVNGMRFCGLISNQHVQRYNKNQLFFFVNRRWVKNYSLTKALLKGYHNILPSDKYPMAVINITIDPASIDVNIHPRKEEVWFSNSSMIEHTLSTTVHKTLQQQVSTDLKKSGIEKSNLLVPHNVDNKEQQVRNKFDVLSHNDVSHTIFHEVAIKPAFLSQEMGWVEKYRAEKGDDQKNITVSNESTYALIGVAHKTYIMLDHDEGILFIDQHAAHERVLFELFEQSVSQSAINTFVFPEILEFSKEDIDIIQEYNAVFTSQGIDLEIFGAHKIIIKAAPVYLKSFQWRPFLYSFIEEIKNITTLNTADVMYAITFKFRASLACKAAVKAGDVLTEMQINQLLYDLNKVSNRMTCPHGRPTQWLLPLRDLEKKFKRI